MCLFNISNLIIRFNSMSDYSRKLKLRRMNKLPFDMLAYFFNPVFSVCILELQ